VDALSGFFVIGRSLAVARFPLFDITTAFMARQEPYPFLPIRHPGFLFVGTSGFVTKNPIDADGCALVAVGAEFGGRANSSEIDSHSRPFTLGTVVPL